MYTMRKGGKASQARARYFLHTPFLPQMRAKKTPGKPGVSFSDEQMYQAPHSLPCAA